MRRRNLRLSHTEHCAFASQRRNQSTKCPVPCQSPVLVTRRNGYMSLTNPFSCNELRQNRLITTMKNIGLYAFRTFGDSGETQKAVQFLSLPIASYYSMYAIHAGTNAERLKLRAYIEQTAQTNQVVAAQIKKEMSY
jgi:hypothetical protein